MAAHTSTKPLLQKLVSSTILSLPIAYYTKERFYSLHTITETTSMSPTLHPGDIVLIRRADFLPYYYDTPGLDVEHLEQRKQHKQQKYSQPNHQNSNDEPNDNDESENNNNNNDDGGRFDSLLDRATDRLRALQMDASVGRPAGHEYTLWRSPPNSSPGDVVVVRCPEAYGGGGRWDVGRLVGLGGQRLQPLEYHRKIQSIPPYSIWIEADRDDDASNTPKSTLFSGKYGPVSKKLLVGQVERVVWPPSRFGRVERVRPPVGRAWWP